MSAKRKPRFECAGSTWRCDFCNTRVAAGDECPSCLLYNAAVVAQKAAANRIAKDFSPNARDAWLNEHGVFAWIGRKTQQVGTTEEAAPFVALTTATRRVKRFWRNGDGTTSADQAATDEAARGAGETTKKENANDEGDRSAQ